jgi:hypothetical protein
MVNQLRLLELSKLRMLHIFSAELRPDILFVMRPKQSE